jgi:phage baseplate assembly protein W
VPVAGNPPPSDVPPGDVATAGRMAREVRIALERWEPRIDVDDVAIAFDSVDDGTLYIDVHYTVRSTDDRRNLVFPFYTIPSAGETTADGGSR